MPSTSEFQLSGGKFRLARIGTTLRAVVAVGVFLILVDQTMLVAFGRDPAWIPPVYYNFQQIIGSRLAAVVRMREQGRLDEKQLVVGLGVSTMQSGLDPKVLTAHDPRDRQWLPIATQGATFINLEIAARVFVDSPVHPGLVVVGVNAMMLHKTPHTEHTHRLTALAADRSWLYRNLWASSALATIETSYAADKVRQIFNLPMDATYAPDPDPFTAQAVFPERDAAADLNHQWTKIVENLRADQYQHNENQADSFKRILAELQDRGDPVVYIVMPSPSALRKLFSKEMLDQFSRIATQANQGRGIRLIDLSQALPDDMFSDWVHLNGRGQERFSTLLPSILN